VLREVLRAADLVIIPFVPEHQAVTPTGRVVKGSLPDGEAEFFYWSDGDVTPLTND